MKSTFLRNKPIEKAIDVKLFLDLFILVYFSFLISIILDFVVPVLNKNKRKAKT